MLFTEPVDFREALTARAVKAALPNELSSRELERLDPALRERSKFSAGVARLDVIERFDELATRIIQPRRVERKGEQEITEVTEGMDIATARLEMKRFLDSIRYRPEEGKEGTIQDLRSDARLNLILKMNTQQVQNYGGWAQGQDPAVLSQWPASELYRAESRDEPRDWPVRWLNAAGEVGDEAAGRALRKYGRMIARKDSKVWVNLGPFKVPYAPFDWNSGMDARDVERGDAIAVEVFQEGEAVTPQTRGLNELLQASPNVRSEELRKAVLEDLGEEFEFEGEVLKKKAAIPRRTPRPAALEAEPKVEQEKTEATKKTKAENPVSAGLQVVRRNPAALEEVKRVIDEIHDDGTLPRIPVDGSTSNKHSEAEFRRTKFGQAIGMGVKAKAGQEFAFMHEIGHFLDHQALGVKGEYASQAAKETVVGKLMDGFRQAVDRSAIIGELRAARQAGKLSDRMFEYWMRPREIWARAYSQWLAQTILKRGIGSERLQASLNSELADSLAGPFQQGQWSEDDFKPVAAAIEEMFRKKGWLLE